MGCYGPFVEEYLAQFSKEQLMVVTLDDYRQDRRAVLTKLFAHLGARKLTEAEWESVLKRDKVCAKDKLTNRRMEIIDTRNSYRSQMHKENITKGYACGMTHVRFYAKRMLHAMITWHNY